jgi:Zn-dependent alcohol dehydrogenase
MSYPISATAIVSDAPKDNHPSWRKEKVQLREPDEDELLVRMIASGVCHTDILISSFPEGVPGFQPYPKILGHEGAGVVEEVGSKVSNVKKGDKVLLSFDYCGREGCRACEDETPSYCNEFFAKNLFNVPNVYQVDGERSAGGLFFGQSSFSSIALVKETSVVNVEQLVKDEEELKLFAPMGCGYQTGAAAVTELVNVGKKDVVVVFGLGGVGMSAIMVCPFLALKIAPIKSPTLEILTGIRLRVFEMHAPSLVSTEYSHVSAWRRNWVQPTSLTHRTSKTLQRTFLQLFERLHRRVQMQYLTQQVWCL